MLSDELRVILAELASTLGGARVEIAHQAQQAQPAPDLGSGPKPVAVPLGGGAVLRIEMERTADYVAQAHIERSARAIRAAARRWQSAEIPDVAAATQSSEAKVRERLRVFLEAFCGSSGADIAAVVHRGRLVSTSAPMTDLQESRLAFIIKLADAEAQKQVGTSHVLIFGDDYLAATFYYGATLVAFTSRALAPDFARHHVKKVCKELVHLLELLDKGPPEPAHTAPV